MRILLLWAALSGATEPAAPDPVAPLAPVSAPAPVPPVPLDPATPPSGEGVLWIGHQRTVGVRKVPLLGPIETVTDVYMLSRVVDDGVQILLVEQPCDIQIRSEGGIQLSFDPASIPRIPPPIIGFKPDGDQLVAGPWAGGWGEFDVDQDGRPGLAVSVKVPICKGKLELSSRTLSTAQARREGGGITGTVAVHIDRKVLHASVACLQLAPKKQSEDVSGVFRYLPAPEAATCATLTPADFPAIPQAPPVPVR